MTSLANSSSIGAVGRRSMGWGNRDSLRMSPATTARTIWRVVVMGSPSAVILLLGVMVAGPRRSRGEPRCSDGYFV